MHTSGFLSVYSGELIALRLRKELLSYIQKVKLEAFIDSNNGDLVSKITGDVDTITNFLNTIIPTLFNNLTNIVAILVLMLAFNWRLSLIVIVVTFLQFFVSVKFSKIVRENQKNSRENVAQHISFLQHVFSGIKFIKAYRSESLNKRKYNGILKDNLNINLKGFYIHFGYSSILSIISFIGSILILSVGIHEITRGNLTIGTLFVFDTIADRFYYFSMGLVNINIELQNIIVAIDRVNSIFCLESEDYSNKKSNMKNKSITFENVSFSYGEGSRIFKNINIELVEGDVYALVGASGQGKTTVSNLLLNFYQPDKGNIYLGNENINDIDLKHLRKVITIVFQEQGMIDGSIKENILLNNNAKIKLSKLQEILELCFIDDFVKNLPNKLETVIGEGGEKLSYGQRQRILLARGILRDSSIYIFDEALANLDKSLESDIFENLQKMLTGKTQIYITHNTNIIKKIENIIVISDGKVEGMGNHDYLMKSSHSYRLFCLQDEKMKEEFRSDEKN